MITSVNPITRSKRITITPVGFTLPGRFNQLISLMVADPILDTRCSHFILDIEELFIAQIRKASTAAPIAPVSCGSSGIHNSVFKCFER